MFSTVTPQKRKKKNPPWLLSFLDHRLTNHNYNLINPMFQAYHIAWLSCNHSPEALNILIPQHWISWTVLCADCLITPLRVTLFALFRNLIQNFIPHVQDLIKLFGNSRPIQPASSIQSSDIKNDRTTMVDNHAAKPRAGTNGTWL